MAVGQHVNRSRPIHDGICRVVVKKSLVEQVGRWGQAHGGARMPLPTFCTASMAKPWQCPPLVGPGRSIRLSTVRPPGSSITSV